MVRSESGQGTIEYVLLLAIVVSLVLILIRGSEKWKLADKLVAPVKADFASAYRYGHPKAKGFDDGGPLYHPRALNGGTNFRIFLNPGQ